MKFCADCFNDKVIVEKIKNLNKNGFCEILNKEVEYIYDTESDFELQELFQSIFDIYVEEKSLPFDYPITRKVPLEDEIIQNWKLFDFNLDINQKKRILNEVFPEKDKLKMIFGIPELAKSTSKENKRKIVKNGEWEDFSRCVKYKNRFFPLELNTEVIKRFISFIVREYDKNHYFFRARIASDKKGFCKKDDIWAPPYGLASAGRVNAAGISRLYLANDEETAICEIRPGIFDYVSVGKFKLLKDIKIVDFSMINEISPFFDFFLDDTELSTLDYAVNIETLEKISEEIAKPMRVSDSKVDYVPVQYLADYILSLNEYDGISFKSTINKKGVNILLFDSEICECLEDEIYTKQISEINYEYK